VALYFLTMKTFGRSAGSSAVSAAAYRAGERIRDERTGRIYDHSDRRDVMHKEILVPSRFADAAMDWARDRANLWNDAERAESRKNARVAREYLVSLPFELTANQRLGLARGFSQELSDRYRFAVDLAIHAPRDFPGSDPRNFHAHLLATTREVTAAGLGAKTTVELNDSKRRDLGLGPSIDELLFVRERWATVANAALKDANIDARIDHRSLRAQGIDREPVLFIPRVPYELERRGFRSFVAEQIRDQHRARVQARLERTLAHGTAEASDSGHSAAPPSTTDSSRALMTLDEIRRKGREAWLRMRQASADSSASDDKDLGRSHDDLTR
jgi:ATP-dependent exoDNAse (exonuclease V) alpha subunit